MNVLDEIIDRALRLHPTREGRSGIRSGLGDAASICDLVAKRIEKANPGRGKNSVSQVGQEIATAVRRAGDEIMAVRDRIDVPGSAP